MAGASHVPCPRCDGKGSRWPDPMPDDVEAAQAAGVPVEQIIAAQGGIQIPCSLCRGTGRASWGEKIGLPA